MIIMITINQIHESLILVGRFVHYMHGHLIVYEKIRIKYGKDKFNMPLIWESQTQNFFKLLKHQQNQRDRQT